MLEDSFARSENSLPRLLKPEARRVLSRRIAPNILRLNSLHRIGTLRVAACRNRSCVWLKQGTEGLPDEKPIDLRGCRRWSEGHSISPSASITARQQAVCEATQPQRTQGSMVAMCYLVNY